jgi:hypothetical protein
MISIKHQKRTGRKGGLKTLRKHGKDYFRRLSLKRRKFSGGRPKKTKLIVRHT